MIAEYASHPSGLSPHSKLLPPALPTELCRGAAVVLVLSELPSLGAWRMGVGKTLEPGATITGGVVCARGGGGGATAAEPCGSALARSLVDGTMRTTPVPLSLMRPIMAPGASPP